MTDGTAGDQELAGELREMMELRDGDLEELATWYGMETGMTVSQFQRWQFWMRQNYPYTYDVWGRVLAENERVLRRGRRSDRWSRLRNRWNRLRMALR